MNYSDCGGMWEMGAFFVTITNIAIIVQIFGGVGPNPERGGDSFLLAGHL